MRLPPVTTVEAVGGEHPELKKGEIFLCNGNEKGFAQLAYITKRKGIKAYGADGRELRQYFPIFASEVEYERLRSQ